MFKQVLKPKDMEGNVLSYEPRIFEKVVPQVAMAFVKEQEPSHEDSSFQINALVSEHTGLSDIEKKNVQTRIEESVLSKLQVVEERARKEAYDLGLEEGRNLAYRDSQAQIQEAIQGLSNTVQSVTEIKKQLLAQNEAHIVRLAFHIGKALALKEIAADPSSVKNVIFQALENAQNEESITLRISPQDTIYLENIKGQMGNPLERMSRLKIETSDAVASGGCIVETNYGQIDASIEQRVKKIFEALEAKVPTVKEGE